MTSELLQPHEGIKGIRRTRDDLLSLEPAALRRRMIILRIARDYWTATMRGSGNEFGRAAYDRMDKPLTGDLVVESISMRRPDAPDADGEERAVHGFGIMLDTRKEWSCSHETWEKEVAQAQKEGYSLTDADRATTEATYVQYGPGPDDVCRWVNATLIALPTGPLHHTEEGQK